MTRTISNVGLALLVSLLLMVCMSVVPGVVANAYASDTSFSGVDSEGLNGETVEVADVQSSGEVTVYVKVTKGSTVVANRLAVTVGGSGSSASTLAVTMPGITESNVGDYAFTVYSDPACKEKLCTGNLAGVYASLSSAGKQVEQFIGVRSTIGDESLTARDFAAAATIEYKDIPYKRDGELSTSDGNLMVPYTKVRTSSAGVTGTITYVSTSGTTVDTRSYENLGDETKTIDIPNFVTDGDGVTYRTLCYSGIVQLSASHPSATVRCAKVETTAYVATINLVDEEGAVLVSDHVTVTKDYTYVAPDLFYQTADETADGAQHAYRIKNESDRVVTLAADEDVPEGGKTVTITYEQVSSDDVTHMIVMVDGTDGTTVLGTKEVKMKEGSESFVVTLDDITYNGKTYTCATGSTISFSADQSSDLVHYVYYLPEGYGDLNPYTVTVQYVDVATGDVLKKRTVTVSPETAETTIDTGEEVFTQDGVVYRRLNGQSADFVHNYYSKVRTYTVYYRDENDTASENLVVTRTVIYTTTLTDTSGGGTIGLTGTHVSITNGTTGDTRNEAGESTDETRINENETPLADAEHQNGNNSELPVVPLAIAAMLIAAGCIAAFVVKRRKKEQQ